MNRGYVKLRVDTKRYYNKQRIPPRDLFDQLYINLATLTLLLV